MMDPHGTHTHIWVAAWWSRALTQLSSQTVVEHETVSFQTLLTQFLHMNRLAAESSGRTCWAYDRQPWTSLQNRIQRQEPHLDIPTEFVKITENEEQRIANDVRKADKAKKQETKQTRRPSQPTNPTRGTAGKGTGNITTKPKDSQLAMG